MLMHKDERGNAVALYATEEEWSLLKGVAEPDRLGAMTFNGIPVIVQTPEIKLSWFRRLKLWLRTRIDRIGVSVTLKLLARARRQVDRVVKQR